MTEIPEHLLKRSRERRSAIGKGGDDAGAASSDDAGTTTSTSPATTAPAAAPAASGPAGRSAAPAPAPAPAPEPEPFYVTAARERRKVPWWAMATLALMPVWGFMYWRALTASAVEASGPVGVGAEVYSNCASCHGGAGEGGVGYPFTGGSVLETFPHIEDQLRYVYHGTEEYNAAGITIYGNPDRPGGPHIVGARGPMPGWAGQLDDTDILAVVCHERYTLGGADPASEEYAAEYAEWCSEESPVYLALEEGTYSLGDQEPTTFVTAEGEEFSPMPIGVVAEGSAP